MRITSVLKTRVPLRWALPCIQIVIVLVAEAWEHNTVPGSSLNDILFSPILGITNALNEPAFFVAGCLSVLLNLSRAIAIGVFLACVFLLWYVVGRNIEMRKHAEGRPMSKWGRRIILCLVYVVIAIWSAHNAFWSWRVTHNLNLASAIIQVVFSVAWALALLRYALRELYNAKRQAVEEQS